MAIKVSQAFERTSAAPIDVTIALTKAQMLTVNDNLMPKYYFTICQDDGKIYLYDKTATASGTTGKFKEFSGGGGGDVKIFTTTATLDKDINDTTVVAAADLPGITWTDLKAGASIVKDAKGTLGVVTLITGTTSVTVTTATTSTPTKELTQAQYDALVAAGTVDPDVIYLVTDQDAPAVYMGAYDTVYSNTERVVGVWTDGKPIYQLTMTVTLATTSTQGTQADIFEPLPTGIRVDKQIDMHGWMDYSYGINPGHLYGSGLGYVSSCIVPDGSTDTAHKNTLLVRNSMPSFSGKTAYITIRYTKVTDTASSVQYASPNDYSTTEKIVGTWIDGKPLYQKTYNLTTPSSTGVTTLLTDASLATVSIKEMHGVVDGANKSGTNTFPVADVNRPAASTYLSGQETSFWIRANGELAMELNYAGACGNPFYLTIKYTKN